MTETEFSKVSEAIRSKYMLALAKDLEVLWGQRVHVSLAVILIDEADDSPKCVMFSDTMGGSNHLSLLMAQAWSEKYMVESMKPPAASMN